MDKVISLLNSYLDLNFEVIKTADNCRFSNGDDIRIVNLGPIVLFANFKLTASSGKYLEDNKHAHIVSTMYKPTLSARESHDLLIGFDPHRSRR